LGKGERGRETTKGDVGVLSLEHEGLGSAWRDTKTEGCERSVPHRILLVARRERTEIDIRKSRHDTPLRHWKGWSEAANEVVPREEKNK
jgi:hypothetical protein